jgi:hypothetical protein
VTHPLSRKGKVRIMKKVETWIYDNRKPKFKVSEVDEAGESIVRETAQHTYYCDYVKTQEEVKELTEESF